MSYALEISDKINRIFAKVRNKDKLQSEILKKKIKDILENPYRFKPLRNNMKGIRRTHIGKSFVLTYEILENERVVRLLDYAHHDRVYD
jgi:YafQ family addiction module toxin component